MKKQTNILIIVLLVLLTAAGGVIAWLVTHRPDPLELEPNVVALTPTPAGQPAPDGIQIPGYPTLNVDSATGTVNTVFQNPEGNRCTFELTLTRIDTGEELWHSGKFKPGTGIQNPALTTCPPPGTYPAALIYTTTSLKDQSPMNGAVINTELVVN